MPEPRLRVENLVKHFPVKGGLFSAGTERVHAVDGVSFSIAPGETLGLVGESGCGKSSTGRCILRLIEPTSGQVWFDGKNVPALDADQLRAVRRDMQIIFQDPYASLNPRMTVGAIVGEALTIHGLAKSAREFEDSGSTAGKMPSSAMERSSTMVASRCANVVAGAGSVRSSAGT